MPKSATPDELKNASLWTALGETRSYEPLKDDLYADACVIGAGVAGLSVAYRLAQDGHKVVVLDDGELGASMTSRTTAHLVTAVDDRYFNLAQLHGDDVARQVAAAHQWAIERIESTIHHERIACDFERVDGFLTAADGLDEVLEQELNAARDAGLLDVEVIDHTVFPLCGTQRCLRFPRQGQLHPLRYVEGLADAVQRLRGHIYGHTHVDEVNAGEPVRVRAGSHTICADVAVVATNTPVTEKIAIHFKQAPYMTYVIAARVPRSSVPRALVWDTGDPYHYVRVQTAPDATHDFLLVGGEDHKTGQADDAFDRFARLEQWARARYLTIGEVEYAWAGQIMESVDRLAFLGPSPSGENGVYVVTGESGTGITHATIAAAIIADHVAGRENAWAALYDPSRRSYRAFGTYVKENINATTQLLDWLSPGEVGSVDEIAPDTGAVLRRGFRKVAAYRDESGRLHTCSATCRHLGCIVRWNSIERTWDCPCHGSRYDRFGKVVSGPAISDLRIIEAE